MYQVRWEIVATRPHKGLEHFNQTPLSASMMAIGAGIRSRLLLQNGQVRNSYAALSFSVLSIVFSNGDVAGYRGVGDLDFRFSDDGDLSTLLGLMELDHRVFHVRGITIE